MKTQWNRDKVKTLSLFQSSVNGGSNELGVQDLFFILQVFLYLAESVV